MKRIVISTLVSFFVLFGFCQKQEVMVIEKTDGTTLRLNVNDIKRAIFESTFINPIGKVAEAVDLGLASGVKWASWNIGATSPTEYGGYYGWADITGQKTGTDVNDYPNNNPPKEISGTNYDIAKALWGGEWRLPSYEDLEEIYSQCNFYKSDDAIIIVGPNMNSISLPLAGSREGSEIYDTVNYGYYWSGTLHPEDNNCAWILNFDMVKGKYGLAGASRHFGLSVRPVYGTPIKITVTTGNATDITSEGATVTGTVSGSTTSITVGIIYGKTSNLDSENGTKKSTTSKDNFSVSLSGLSASTTYYYRAYAVHNGTYYYGDTKNFTTKSSTTGTLNGHEWVDLGLPSGTKWATCNVGASTATEYGYYYAWGETSTKSYYSDSNYPNGNNSNIPYNIAGTSYDVAKIQWGSTWRMPTFTEISELANKCSFEWTTMGGNKGAKLIGPNGNYIFLPAGGGIGKGFANGISDVSNRGIWGYYWSATMAYRQNYNEVKELVFNSDGIKLRSSFLGSYYDTNTNGFNGLLVRPVTN